MPNDQGFLGKVRPPKVSQVLIRDPKGVVDGKLVDIPIPRLFVKE